MQPNAAPIKRIQTTDTGWWRQRTPADQSNSILPSLALARAGFALRSRLPHLGSAGVLLEKAPVIGGTTAWSGGWIWCPGNPVAQRAGIVEDPALPRAQLEAMTFGFVAGRHAAGDAP